MQFLWHPPPPKKKTRAQIKEGIGYQFLKTPSISDSFLQSRFWTGKQEALQLIILELLYNCNFGGIFHFDRKYHTRVMSL